MVRLDRIYTRSGDTGQTSLGDGSRIEKTSPRIAAMGAVDEVNSHLGMALSSFQPSTLSDLLTRIQQQLFDLGADLCTPVPQDRDSDKCPRIDASHVEWLEGEIDQATEQLLPLTSFILPGGRPTAAAIHLARAVCRRAEREFHTVLLSEDADQVNETVGIYLNRLSDLLFVLARIANDAGREDILWVPGANSPESDRASD